MPHIRSSPGGCSPGCSGATPPSLRSRAVCCPARSGSPWQCGQGRRLVGRRRGAPPATRSIQGLTTPLFTSIYTSAFTRWPLWKKWGGMMSPSLDTTPRTITFAGNMVDMATGTCSGSSHSHLLFCRFTFWTWVKFLSSEENIRLVFFLPRFLILTDDAGLLQLQVQDRGRHRG